MTIRRLLHTTVYQYARKNHYDTLQLNHRADKKTIKAQYYRLSKKYHPDLNPNDKEAHEKFLEVNEAYAVLGNEASKRKYDNELSPSAGGGNYSRSGGGNYAHAWQFKRRTPRATGSASAKEQAERMKNHKGPLFNEQEHYTRHYEAEEIRRQKRMEQAAERRKAAGVHDVNGSKENSTWSRFWRLGVILSVIAYATQVLD